MMKSAHRSTSYFFYKDRKIRSFMYYTATPDDFDRIYDLIYNFVSNFYFLFVDLEYSRICRAFPVQHTSTYVRSSYSNCPNFNGYVFVRYFKLFDAKQWHKSAISH